MPRELAWVPAHNTSQQGGTMIPVNILHKPFELMLFYGVALIGLAVVQQAGNLGRLIARRMLRAERRNTAASGYHRPASVA
jgi:hypothetical protein